MWSCYSHLGNRRLPTVLMSQHRVKLKWIDPEGRSPKFNVLCSQLCELGHTVPLCFSFLICKQGHSVQVGKLVLKGKAVIGPLKNGYASSKHPFGGCLSRLLGLSKRVIWETLVCCLSLDCRFRADKRLLSIGLVLPLLVLQAELVTSRGS